MALLPELDVKSVLHIVEENFQRIGLKTYANRMMYIGEHTLSKEEIIEKFKKSVEDVNSGYCEINVCGLLLVYDTYFVHVLEGSEDTLHRHLRFLFAAEQDYIKQMEQQTQEDDTDISTLPPAVEGEAVEIKMFKRMKMLVVFHSIETLVFDRWRAVTARPPVLISKLDIYAAMQAHMDQLRVCLDKIAKLCDLAKNDDLVFDGLSAADPKMDALPEAALLDYLLASPHVLDLRHVAHLHRRVDDYVFYFESVWPLPTHYTPRHLYKLKVDDSFVEPLPVMPWELVKEEPQGDEAKEGRETDSDSD